MDCVITIPIMRTLSPASQSKYFRKSYTLTIGKTPIKYLFLPLVLMRQVMRKYADVLSLQISVTADTNHQISKSFYLRLVACRLPIVGDFE